jgi:uncharacterized protein (DUF2252 family)
MPNRGNASARTRDVVQDRGAATWATAEIAPVLRPVAPYEDSERARVLPGQKLGMVSPELLEYAVRGVSVFWVIP